MDTRRQRETYGITTQNKHAPLYFSSLEGPLGFHARRAPELRETRVHRASAPTSGQDSLPTNFPSLAGLRGRGCAGLHLGWGGGGGDAPQARRRVRLSGDTHQRGDLTATPEAPAPRPAPSSPVLSFAGKPGELSLARLGLGGPSSKFSAIFTCSRKQPRERTAGPARAPGQGSAPPRPAARGEELARAASRERAPREREGAGPGGGGGGQISATATAPRSAHRPPPAAAAAVAGRGPPHPLPASRARHSAAGAPRRPSRPPGPGRQRRRPAGRLRQSRGTWCRRRAAASLPPPPRAPLN